MNIDELIDYLPDKLKKSTIYVYVCKKIIPAKKIGNKLFFDKLLIDKWNESRTIIK